jgi:hypothetical protein
VIRGGAGAGGCFTMNLPVVAARMGFDPRRWRPPPGPRQVTANIDGLIAENQALRWQVQQLREEILRLRRAAERSESWRHGDGVGAGYGAAAEPAAQSSSSPGAAPRSRPGAAAGAAAAAGSGGPGRQRVTRGAAPSVTAAQVERWGEAMARHPAWGELRIGPPGGLRGLVEALRARAWNPSLSLEEELDRRQSGLGADLAAALRGPHSRGRWAVRAAFALYGPQAFAWLNEEPLRVVGELRRLLERLEPPAGAGAPSAGQGPRRRQGTRTANHSGAEGDPRAAGGDGARSGGGSRAAGAAHGEGSRAGAGARRPPGGGSQGRDQRQASGASGGREPGGSSDPRRQALTLLGLEPGASLQLIKRTYRQLAKTHHPDLGGDAEAFRRLDAAYRLLIG